MLQPRPVAAAPRWLLALAPGLVVACGPQEGGQSGAEVIESEPDVVAEPSPQNPLEPGASECGEDSDCEAIAEERLVSFEEPAAAPSVERASCDNATVILEQGSVSGNYCSCEFTGGGSAMLGPSGIGCSRLGRSGECLFDDEVFTGCEMDDEASCDDDCALLESRLAEDAARTFETAVLHAACGDGVCIDVVSIDGQCYVNESHREGRSYDCSLGVDAILEADAEDRAGPELIERPAEFSNYVPGTDGTLSLTVNHAFTGAAAAPLMFSARADFVSVDGGTSATTGEVLDALEGLDDCGALQQGNMGTDAAIEWFAADEAVLLDGEDEYPFEVYTPGFTFYGLDLTALGAEPRFGGKYGFRAAGGTLMSAFESNELTLPEDLSFPELEQITHLARGPIHLEWTGRGEQPLQLRMSVRDKLADSFNPVVVECLLEDDGDYTIPETVLEGVPDGFVSLYVRRRARTVPEMGEDAFVLEGEVAVSHEVVLGERCETPEVLEACLDSLDVQRQTKEACGAYDPEFEVPVDQACPSYLAETCQGCVEFYECQAENLRCENGGIVSYAGCSCP